MTVLGYARVSTQAQHLEQQLDELTTRGCERIWQEKMSGARADRPELAALLDYAREGDTVWVSALDRLGRDLRGIVETVHQLDERGIVLRTVREGIDSSAPIGQMLMGIFASLAQYERTLIKERAAAARAAARARGRHVGRPKVMTPDQVSRALWMREQGETIPTICERLEVSRTTLYRELNGANNRA